MNFAALFFELQTLATFAMTGLIWFVQIVHYPLFALVGSSQHRTYAQQHQRRTGWVVAPLMLVELATAFFALSPVFRPIFLTRWNAIEGMALLAIIWASTALLQIPIHRQLLAGKETAAVRKLVTTNWVRTAAWTARCALLLTAALYRPS